MNFHIKKVDFANLTAKDQIFFSFLQNKTENQTWVGQKN